MQIENGLNEEELKKQREEIERVNLELEDEGFQIKVLQGCEANILEDGSLDIDDESLEALDYVIAGIHSHFKLPEEEMTEKIN